LSSINSKKRTRGSESWNSTPSNASDGELDSQSSTNTALDNVIHIAKSMKNTLCGESEFQVLKEFRDMASIPDLQAVLNVLRETRNILLQDRVEVVS
jgi:hypothetical protein